MDSGFTFPSQLQIGSPYPDWIVNRDDTFRDDIGTDNRWEEVSQHFSSDFSTTFTFRKNKKVWPNSIARHVQCKIKRGSWDSTSWKVHFSHVH